MSRTGISSRASRLLLPLLLLVLGTGGALPRPVLAGSGSDSSPPVGIHGVDPGNMDLSADPGVDFYRFANGGWLNRTTIPADEGSYSLTDEIRDGDRRDLLALLDRLAVDATLAEGTDEWKVVRLLRQGTDLATRDAQGIEPIGSTLAEIDAIDDLAGFHRFLRGAAFAGVPGLFPIWGRPDPGDASVVVAHLGGPWLGLPDREYYLDEDSATEQARLAYLRASAELLTFTGIDRVAARESTLDVYDFERRLAEQTLPRELSGDLARWNNPRTIADLARAYPLMDWPGYLAALGIADQPRLIVLELQYLSALPNIVAETPLDVLKDYLRVQLLWNASDALSEEIEEVAFSFHGVALGGLETMPPIEERALDAVGWSLGDAVGKLYVAQRFSPEAKAQATALVEEVRDAFQRRLGANPWLSAETKAHALDKLASMGVKVGYPERWRGYDAVEITNSYFGSVRSADNARMRHNLGRIGKPVDRGEWLVPAQAVNAFYFRDRNEIVIPAGILQPPFFDPRADPASNFGGIGVVIGHEITHGFDPLGAQVDAEGNLNDWWATADRARFRELSGRLAAQYWAIELRPGLSVDGWHTSSENIADLGGIQVAHDALRRRLETTGGPLPPPPFARANDAAVGIAPYKQEQRFFVSAASVWRVESRDRYLTTAVKTDSHAPGSVRGTQPLRNMDAFFAAFDIQPDDPMWLPPEERIVIW